MKIIVLQDANNIDDIVEIHMKTFTGFFLTFLGRGFLKHLYKGFVTHPDSNLIVALDDNDKAVGFLAYSFDISGFYKYLIKKSLIPFAFYSMIAFFKKPKVMFRLIRAFTYSDNSKREENYIELSSIGVNPDCKKSGIGSALIDKLKTEVSEINTDAKYIKLETDAKDNEIANAFYVKNGFVLDNSYFTREGREMNEYRFYLS
jgi:ribosomal protein S18 acetylase RimI-like enzyme